MQAIPNGFHNAVAGGSSNGHDRTLVPGLDDAPSQEELESELPDVAEGQVSLGELLSRVAQSIYSELTEMADTLPNMSDSARKRTIADWVVKTKKQVVKLYAVMKWSRDARDVQKAMNITAFLMDQNRQFEESIQAVAALKESLAPARLRNHDLLTSLDVLTTGTYLRLPTQIKKFFIPPEPLSDVDVQKTLQDMDFVIKYRLRMSEVIPCEMSHFVVEGGRAYFTAPNLFRVTLSLRGAQKNDGWFFVNLEFLHDVDGDAEEVQDFPRTPIGDMKRHVTEEADSRLNYYTPLPEEASQPGLELPPRPQLPSGKVDAPLVRLYNFLQMMSLTYQLEILFFQASRLRSLGWREYLNLKRAPDGKSFVASYWIRPSQNDANRPSQSNLNRPRIPPIGGTVTVSLKETHASARAGGGPLRTPMHRILSELQQSSKISGAQPSDEVETFALDVRWEPTAGALGITIPPELMLVQSQALVVNPTSLNFESIITTAIRKHIDCILAVYQHSLLNGPFRSIFARPGDVILAHDGSVSSLRVRLCADEVVVVSIETRTGRITLRGVGELAAAGRGPRFALFSERLNQNPLVIYDCLVHLRYNTILELVEQKAHYLGLQTYRTRNFSPQDYMRFGHSAKMQLFIQLARSPTHYLVVVIAEMDFRFALISTQVISETLGASVIIEDIGWLDVRRIHDDRVLGDQSTKIDPSNNGMGGFNPFAGADQFKMDTGLLRELYAYCCARVAYTKVELQLKLRGIPCAYLEAGPSNTSDLSSLQSSLSRSVPVLCVQSSDILAGAPAAEAAMPNIRVIPLNWWSTKKSQVITCVKLKYVQQPVGKRAGTSTVIRPSKRIVYDTREAVVSFLSESVDSCVDEFLEEWAKVSKIVVIAREVAQMSRRASWDDVRLLSFDLQTVEFAYAQDYTVAITCTDQLLASSNSSYDLAFSRVPQKKRLRLDVDPFTSSEDNDEAMENPHEDSEPFLRHVLRQGPRLSSSLHQLVLLLRNTLPVVCVLDSIRKATVSGRDKDAQAVGVDTFAKAAGWFRILYGDMRHALDFRILSNSRVAVFDAAYTSHLKAQERPAAPFIPGHRAKPSIGGADQANKKHVTFAGSDDVAGAGKDSSKSVNTVGLLQPIQDFANLVREAAQDLINSNASSNTPALPSGPSSSRPFTRRHVALLDMGVVCSVDDVDALASRIHSRIVRMLLKQKSDAESAASASTSSTPSNAT